MKTKISLFALLCGLIISSLQLQAQAPTISSLSPVDNAVDIAIGTNIVISFNEPIAYGGGNIKLYKMNGGSAKEVFVASADGATLSLSGSTLTINPTDDFDNNWGYYLEFSSTAIKDLSGEFFAGFSSYHIWNFKTVATGTAPTDISLSATSFNENLADNTAIASISVVDADANTNSYEIVEKSGWFGDLWISGSELRTGWEEIQYGRKSSYDITIKATDDDNNVFLKDFKIIVNNLRPEIVSTLPADNATGVHINQSLVITFDDLMMGREDDYYIVSLKTAIDDETVEEFFSRDLTYIGNTVIINPTSDLSALTEYYISYPTGAMRDVGGENTFNLAASDWSFTTGNGTLDNIAPSLSSLSPADGNSSANNNGTIEMEFDEEITTTLGSLYLRKVSDNSIVSELDVSEVEIKGTYLYAEFGSLEFGTDYYIEIASGVIEDLAGNAFAGTNSTTWNFTTDTAPTDTNLPFIQTTLPLNAATGVSKYSNLYASYNEGLFLGSGDILVKASSNDATVASIPASSALSSNGNIYFPMPANIESATSYYVEIPSGVFLDNAGNATEAFVKGDWAFTTEELSVADVGFKHYLLTLVDAANGGNDDGYIQLTEAENYTGVIDYRSKGEAFIDATGVEYFENITELLLYSNDLKTVDVGSMTSLLELGLNNNYNLESVDISGAPNLTELSVQKTLLSSLDLSVQTKLDYLYLTNALFTSLDLTNNTLLTGFYVDNCPNLTSMDISQCAILREIEMGDVPMTSLDVSGNTDLVQINIGYIPIEDWDISMLTNLERLDMYDMSLTSLNLSGLSSLTQVSIGYFDFDELDLSVVSTLESVYIYNIPTISSLDLSANLSLTKVKIEMMDNLVNLKLNNGNNAAITTANFTNNPNLYCIQVDNVDDATANWTNKDAHSSYNTSCEEVVSVFDAGFRAYLKTLVDAANGGNGDGQIQVTEAEAYTGLINYSNKNLSDVTGLEAFINTTNLTLPLNVITSLDLTMMTNLTTLNLDDNSGLIDLNVEGVNGLINVKLRNVGLSSIDLSNWAELSDFRFGSPTITTINLESNPLLEDLYLISCPQLTSIEYTSLAQLGHLTLREVGLTSLDISSFTSTLEIFELEDTQIEFLDLSGCAYLTEAFVTSNSKLVALDLKNIVNISWLNDFEVTGSPDLSCIEVDDVDYATTTWTVIDEGISFSLECQTPQVISFDTILDKVYGDADFQLSASSDAGLGLTYTVVSGPATLVGDMVTITGVGTVTIAANQAGDLQYQEAVEVTRSFTVVKADQVITLTAIDNTVASSIAIIDVVASVNTNLTLVYDVSGPATISGTTITLDGTADTVSVTVTQAGNENYNSASETITFDVAKVDQIITLEAIADKLSSDAAIEVVASVDTELALTYEVAGPATISGTTITLDGTAGTVSLTVSQVGNDTYNVASASITFEVTEPEVTLAVSPSEFVLKVYPNPATNWINIEGINNGAQLQVIDMQGKVVLSESLFNQTRISTQQLMSGLYILRISNANTITTSRFQIQR